MVKSLLLASAIPLIGGGCGGLAATPAFSPLMLLMPGLGQSDKTTPPSTNQPTQVASIRDSSKID
jgi:hypothetical protein